MSTTKGFKQTERQINYFGYEGVILPYLVNQVCDSTKIRALREQMFENFHENCGLEIGFGSGLNLPFLNGKIQTLYALDPAIYGRKLAQERIQNCNFSLRFLDFEPNRISLESNSLDFVISTFNFCTITPLQPILKEIHRVLKPQKHLLFLEHGQNRGFLKKIQDFLTPFHKTIAGGCCLNRNIFKEIEDAGFTLKARTFAKNSLPLLYQPIYTGIAIKNQEETNL